MNVNKYYDLYNNLEENKFEDFENKFLNIDKNVCLKLCVFDDSKIIELSIDPKEKNDITFDLKLACLFQNAILTRNMNLIKYINNKYNAIDRWKSLPEKYFGICFDPVYSATKHGYIDVLRYLSKNNAIEKNYFENNIFSAKIVQIACLVNFGYNKDQIINFLKTIYNLNDNSIITYEGSFGKTFNYNFEDIKNKIIDEINIQIQINSQPE
jgi:hypothetical protein